MVAEGYVICTSLHRRRLQGQRPVSVLSSKPQQQVLSPKHLASSAKCLINTSHKLH